MAGQQQSKSPHRLEHRERLALFLRELRQVLCVKG
jgi:hypothetical protein